MVHAIGEGFTLVVSVKSTDTCSMKNDDESAVVKVPQL
jgi:hypothetical protein